MSGTAKAISWKSNSTARWIPQDRPYAKPIAAPRASPWKRMAMRVTGTTETANNRAWTSSSVTGDGKTRYSGASVARIGLKWSPSWFMPGCRTSTIGAPRCAYPLTACSKIARSHDGFSTLRKRSSDISV